jgi:hypothetical protein
MTHICHDCWWSRRPTLNTEDAEDKPKECQTRVKGRLDAHVDINNAV